MEKFGTVLTCMDGRIQRKVNDYLNTSFGVRNLDTITTAGLVRHLAEATVETSTLLRNVEVSTEAHGSSQIAVVAHHDCAGNPVADKTQKAQIATAVQLLRKLKPEADVVGLWVSERSIIEKVKVP